MKKILFLSIFMISFLLCSCEILNIDDYEVSLEKRSYSFYLEPDYSYDCSKAKQMILDEFSNDGEDSIAEISKYFFEDYYYKDDVYYENTQYSPKITKVSPKEVEKFFHLKLFYVSWVSKMQDAFDEPVEYDQNIVHNAPVYGNMLFMIYNNKAYKMYRFYNNEYTYAMGAYSFTIYGSASNFKLDYLFQFSNQSIGVLHYTFYSKKEKLVEYSWNGYSKCLEDDNYSYSMDDYYFETKQDASGEEVKVVVSPYIQRRPLYVIKYTEDGILKYYLVNDDIKLNDYYTVDEYVPTLYIAKIKFMKEVIPEDYFNTKRVVFYNPNL